MRQYIFGDENSNYQLERMNLMLQNVVELYRNINISEMLRHICILPSKKCRIQPVKAIETKNPDLILKENSKRIKKRARGCRGGSKVRSRTMKKQKVIDEKDDPWVKTKSDDTINNSQNLISEFQYDSNISDTKTFNCQNQNMYHARKEMSLDTDIIAAPLSDTNLFDPVHLTVSYHNNFYFLI